MIIVGKEDSHSCKFRATLYLLILAVEGNLTKTRYAQACNVNKVI